MAGMAAVLVDYEAFPFWERGVRVVRTSSKSRIARGTRGSLESSIGLESLQSVL